MNQDIDKLPLPKYSNRKVLEKKIQKKTILTVTHIDDLFDKKFIDIYFDSTEKMRSPYTGLTIQKK